MQKLFIAILLLGLPFSLIAMEHLSSKKKYINNEEYREMQLFDSIYSNNGDLVHAVYLPAFRRLSITTIVPSVELNKPEGLLAIANKDSFFVIPPHSVQNMKPLGITWLADSVLICATLADMDHERDALIVSRIKYGRKEDAASSTLHCLTPDSSFKKIVLLANRAQDRIIIEAVIKYKNPKFYDKIRREIIVFPESRDEVFPIEIVKSYKTQKETISIQK